MSERQKTKFCTLCNKHIVVQSNRIGLGPHMQAYHPATVKHMYRRQSSRPSNDRLNSLNNHLEDNDLSTISMSRCTIQPPTLNRHIPEEPPHQEPQPESLSEAIMGDLWNPPIIENDDIDRPPRVSAPRPSVQQPERRTPPPAYEPEESLEEVLESRRLRDQIAYLDRVSFACPICYKTFFTVPEYKAHRERYCMSEEAYGRMFQ